MKSDEIFRSVIGLTKDHFQSLCNQIVLSRNTTSMTKEEALMLFLIHYRHGLSIRVMSWLFDVCPKTVTNIINDVTEDMYKWAQTKITMASWSERDMDSVRFRNKTIVVMLDGTEQRVQRPKSKDYDRLVYSGKKKQHSFTLLLVCSPTGKIYFISPSYPGSYNDASLMNMRENFFWRDFEKDEYIAADKGFIGLNNLHHCLTPIKKKSKDEPLTDAQETYNHEFSAHRCIVENVFSRIKQWKCCSSMFKCDEQDLQTSLVIYFSANFITKYRFS